jgi:hypothetical protein
VSDAVKSDAPTDISFKDVAERIAKVSAGCLAAAYVSGFLIVNISLSTYGIGMSGGDVIKAKYIYIGFLYLAAFSICTLLFALHHAAFPPLTIQNGIRVPANYITRAVERTKQPKTARWVAIVCCLLISVGARLTYVDRARYDDLMYHLNFELLLILAYQILFAVDAFGSVGYHKSIKRSFLFELVVTACIVSLFVLPLLTRTPISVALAVLTCLILSVAGLLFARWKRLWGSAENQKFESLMRGVTVAIALIAILELGVVLMIAYSAHPQSLKTVLNFFPVWQTPWLQRVYLAASAPIVAMLLSFCILHLLIYMTYLIEQGRSCDSEDRGTAPMIPMWIIRTVPVVALVVISVQGFAHNIYDYIPVSRGGADYSTAQISSICIANPARLTSQHAGIEAAKLTSPTPDTPTPTSHDNTELAGNDENTCKDGVLLKHQIILEDNADNYYTASVDDYGPKPEEDDVEPPHRLSLAARQRQCAPFLWRHHRYLPSVTTLNRADVLWVIDEGSASHRCRTPK